ncbi:MAG: glutaredoxin family protein [Pseudomonadales bacterium]|nr:glutaredoxin family protein [Pseudomonadales bacterium]NRA16174.1 glutaredoxin family protein [Oceanospirillaceae bacterium]
MKNFTLFSTEHCHLCELAEDILVSQLDSQLHSVAVADVAEDDLLLARYGVRIPVLLNEKTKAELSWPFDAPMVDEFISR